MKYPLWALQALVKIDSELMRKAYLYLIDSLPK